MSRKRVVAICVVVAIPCLCAVIVAVRYATRDKSELKGTWIIVSADLGTDSLSLLEAVARGGQLTFGEHEMTVTGTKSTQFNYKIDKDFKFIDLVDSHGETCRGIYSVHGDELTLCLGDGDRPTDFKARAIFPSQIVFVCKRK